MIENEDSQGQVSRQGKLVLPAYPEPEEEPYPYSEPQQPQLRPDQLIRFKTRPAPDNPLAKISYYWHKDSAYKVLIIATAILLVAGLIFLSLATTAFLRNPNLFASNTAPQNPTGVSPSGTVDLRPTFPTPGGGSGGNSSSQPPLQSTPVLPTTPTPGGSPTPTPSPGAGGSLTVDITSIPGQVNDNTTVPVGVTTNEPGATVRLQVNYTAYPYYYQSGARVTDDNGNATLYWNVQVSTVRGRHVVARVVAVATDQNGQYATSPTNVVQVNVGFGFAIREQDNFEDLVA